MRQDRRQACLPPGPDISQARNTSNKAMRAKGAGRVASIPRIAGAPKVRSNPLSVERARGKRLREHRKVRSNPLSVERGICGRTGGKLACRPVLTYRRQGIRAIKPCERREQGGLRVFRGLREHRRCGAIRFP